ncbi:MAG: precorrin-4 C(11)-methyltransferase [Lachnospiraceae bacterium]|nr:precorrin-4 C(11)-methyltransferase [Lachnospiraceae bacterium]
MVHFVGAGPGAEDLITVRGRKMLERADGILYAGSLVNPALLAYARDDCTIFNTAKMTLDQVIDIMDQMRDREVVRLHTGDPTLYGAIREQMVKLDALGIAYDLVPGVSAYQAAAASLRRELTLPDVSQSVILTRQGGRTTVPDRQTVRSYAEHGATMILYLSASLTFEAREELLAGGYAPETPVAVVYKASWPEECILHSDVAHFPENMEREGIARLAVIMIGDAFAEKQEKVSESKLYSQSHSTGYREAEKKLIWMCACTEKGAALMEKLEETWSRSTGDTCIFAAHVKCASHPKNEKAGLRELVGASFSCAEAMIFFTSTGIAVRSVAPFLKGKTADPAVLVVDEAGKFCIPLLSGHIGGANRYAEEVSRLLGAQPVVTTATDLEHKFAVDVFAKDNGLIIQDCEKMKKISARVVRGEVIRVYCQAEIEGNVPQEIRLVDEANADLLISDRADADLLIPNLSLGIGCRKNVPRETLMLAFHRICETGGFSQRAVVEAASIDIKEEEAGLLNFCEKQKLPVHFYTAEELMAVSGTFEDSDFVKKVTGIGNVCERAAVKTAGKDAELVVPKTTFDGVTMAIARRNFTVRFAKDSSERSSAQE